MKLVWTKSGDWIDCVPVDRAFTEYWLHNQTAITYKSTTEHKQLGLCAELNQTYNRIKVFLDKINLNIFSKDVQPNGFIQNHINELHANWVKLHVQYPKIKQIFGEQFERDFDLLNKLLHDIEESWTTVIQSQDKPFINTQPLPLNFGDANIKLLYSNLGRSTYNKWLNFDETVKDLDTNDYNEIYPNILLKLSRPYSTTPPIEYATWCSEHNARPTADNILLANFRDLSNNLDTYRTLFMKNFVLSNNDVIFTT